MKNVRPPHGHKSEETGEKKNQPLSLCEKQAFSTQPCQIINEEVRCRFYTKQVIQFIAVVCKISPYQIVCIIYLMRCIIPDQNSAKGILKQLITKPPRKWNNNHTIFIFFQLKNSLCRKSPQILYNALSPPIRFLTLCIFCTYHAIQSNSLEKKPSNQHKYHQIQIE